MKAAVSGLLLVLLLAFGNAAVAALYRGLDAGGNVVYSDTPFESAEKFAPPPISVVEGPKVSKSTPRKGSENGEKPAAFRYLTFDIVEPAYDQTLHNPEQLRVSLRLKPGLNTQAGHTIWLLLNRKPVIRNSQQLQFTLDPPERGAHQLQAQIRDSSGKIVARTRAVVFFIRRGSVR